MCGPQQALQLDDHGAGSLLPQLHGLSAGKTRGFLAKTHEG
jgi:hypothetical protein